MRFKVSLLIGIICILTATAAPQDPEWLKQMKQIQLLSSTYDDVIKILGMPIDGSSEKELAENFDIDQGRVFVGFESGVCVVTPYSDGKPIGWKVPKWTVISISFTPNKPFSPKKLGVDLKGFHRYPVSDVPGAFIYENDELGIDFSMNSKGKISYVSFDPPKKLENLHCR